MNERTILLNANYYYVKSSEFDVDSMDSLFSTPWTIIPKIKRKKNQQVEEEVLGELNFEGTQKNGRVVLNYELKNAIAPQNLAYIFSCISEWTFSQKDVYSMQITAPQDSQSTEALKKIGFEEQPSEPGILTIAKESGSYMFLFVCIGVLLGMSLGGCFGNVVIGIPIGVGLGLALGSSLDKREKNHRKIIEGKVEKKAK